MRLVISTALLPAAVRDTGTFKTALKTQLFNSAYMPRHWQPSIGASDSLYCDIRRQLKKSIDWLIDWLIDFLSKFCDLSLDRSFLFNGLEFTEAVEADDTDSDVVIK